MTVEVQRDKPKSRQFIFATAGNCDLCWTLDGDIALIRDEAVDGKALDQTATLDAPNRSGPFESSKGVGHAGSKSVRWVAPWVPEGL